MAFRYRRNLTGNAVIPVKDFPLSSSYAPVAQMGDAVRLVNGEIVKATASDPDILGVLEGAEYEGLGQTPKIATVRLAPTAVYEADFVGTGPLTIGAEYGIDDSGNVDTDNTTNRVVKIVEVVGGKPYVVFTARQLV